jgi:integrase
MESVPIGGLVDDYLRNHERNKASATYLRDLRSRLGHFKEAFGSRAIRTLGARELEEWLHASNGNLSLRTLFNQRKTMHAFFGWAAYQKHVDSNPVDGIAKPKVVQGPPAIWTPEDLLEFLTAAPPEILPLLVIGGFAGLRTAELMRLDWAEVSPRFIEVTARKAKTASRRLVTIEPNLAEWLAPYADMSGKIWQDKEARYHHVMRRLSRKLGLKWPANGLRHSFCSYHLAKFQDAPRTALQMGHSGTRLIFENYRELVTPEAAERYWAIRPNGAA